MSITRNSVSVDELYFSAFSANRWYEGIQRSGLRKGYKKAAEHAISGDKKSADFLLERVERNCSLAKSEKGRMTFEQILLLLANNL